LNGPVVEGELALSPRQSQFDPAMIVGRELADGA
jgi:hypothetical protein